jgi:hypothetical protein
MTTVLTEVRFRDISGHQDTSALPPQADMIFAVLDVRFVPKADIAWHYSITLSAIESTPGGTSMPSARAV